MRNLICVAIILVVAFAGCQKKQQESAQQMPITPKVVAVPAQLVGVVDKIGGLKTWADTEIIACECTYTVYKADGTKYITTQRHAVYPWSDTIRVYANEPSGKYIWSLFREDFKMIEGPDVPDEQLPAEIGNRQIVEAIWSMLAVPARIASLTQDSAKPGQSMLIDGLWYDTIVLTSERTYYLDKSSGIITLCLIPGANGKYYLARGYDFRPVTDTLIWLPGKIEIFESDAQARLLKRVVEVDYSRQQAFSF
jgi:hypothetical protein